MSTGAISDECVYDLDVDGVGEPVRVAQDPLAKLSAGSGTTVWDSAIALCGYLMRSMRSRPRTALDLSAGTGIVGLTLARLGVERVLLSDIPNSVPLLSHNIEMNDLADRVSALPLKWGDAGNTHDIRQAIDPIDLIVASDLFAWPDLYLDLARTIDALASTTTTVLLAYEERNPAVEGGFFRMLHKKFAIREIPIEALHPEYRSPELHIFEARRRATRSDD
ncbi:Lysine methyltransferase [Plasmodiophora brassicae]